MDQKRGGDPTYVLGRSAEETNPLERLAELFEAPTRIVLQEAGITTGMKVLDIGCGAGDVAFLVAELFGETGRVVGVDLNPHVIATARSRALMAGMTQVSFVHGDIRRVEPERDFDAVVGRMVLMYQADPVAILRMPLRALRDGGLAVFYEANVTRGVTSFPVSPLHQLLGRCLSETFARGGVELAIGPKLHQVFLVAGLEAPRMRMDALVGGERKWIEQFARSGADTLLSLMPLILEYGVATEDEICVETFDRRYCDEVLRQGSVVQWFPFVGAWAHKRAAT